MRIVLWSVLVVAAFACKSKAPDETPAQVKARDEMPAVKPATVVDGITLQPIGGAAVRASDGKFEIRFPGPPEIEYDDATKTRAVLGGDADHRVLVMFTITDGSSAPLSVEHKAFAAGVTTGMNLDALQSGEGKLGGLAAVTATAGWTDDSKHHWKRRIWIAVSQKHQRYYALILSVPDGKIVTDTELDAIATSVVFRDA